MRFEREITVSHLPFWYRAIVRGSVFGVFLGTLVALFEAGIAGLLVLLFMPLVLLFRLVRFPNRRVLVRIDDAFEIVEGNLTERLGFDEVRVHERHGRTVALEVRFPYRGSYWHGVLAEKDAPGSVTVSGADDPALYAQLRGTLRS